MPNLFVMSLILSGVGLLTIGLVIYLSFQIRDEVYSLATWLVAGAIFLLSFLLGPLWIRLIMLGAFFLTVSYFGEHLSLFFYRQLKK